MDLSPINFDRDDLSPIEIPVKIAKKYYVLKEAKGDIATRYKNFTLRMIAITKDGMDMRMGSRKPLGAETGGVRVVEEGMADADPFLVSLCLFEVTDSNRTSGTKEGLGKVALSWVRDLPNPILDTLVDRVKAISHIGQPSTLEEIEAAISDLSEQRDKLIEDGDKSVPKDKPAFMQATSD